jgi:hypothetical protein
LGFRRKVLDSLKEFGGSKTLSDLESSISTAFDSEGTPLDILRKVEGRVQAKREELAGPKVNWRSALARDTANPASALYGPSGTREATLSEKDAAEALGRLERLLEKQIELMRKPTPVEITADKRPAQASNPRAGLND